MVNSNETIHHQFSDGANSEIRSYQKSIVSLVINGSYQLPIIVILFQFHELGRYVCNKKNFDLLKHKSDESEILLRK